MPSSSRSKATNSNLSKKRKKNLSSTQKISSTLVKEKGQEKLNNTLGAKLSSEKFCSSGAIEPFNALNAERKVTREDTHGSLVLNDNLHKGFQEGHVSNELPKDDSKDSSNSPFLQEVHPLLDTDKVSYSSQYPLYEEDTVTMRRRRKKKNIENEESQLFTSLSDEACSFVGGLFRLKYYSSVCKDESAAVCKQSPASTELEGNIAKELLSFENIVRNIFPTYLRYVWNQICSEECTQKFLGSSTECLPKNAEELWKWTPVRLLTASIREWQLYFVECLQKNNDQFAFTALPHGKYYHFKWLKDEAFLVNIDREEARKCIRELIESYRGSIRELASFYNTAVVEEMLLKDGYLIQDKSVPTGVYPVAKERVKLEALSLNESECLKTSKFFDSHASSERIRVLPKSPVNETSNQDNVGELKHNHRKGTSCPACHARTSAKHRAKDASEVSWKGYSNFVLKWLDSVVYKHCEVCFGVINDGLEDSYSPGLVFASCIVCGVTVHALCYGVQEEEDILFSSMKGMKRFFLCSPCSEETFMVPCVICNWKGGALKKTEDGNFAHLYCALWTPKVFVKDTELMEPVVNLALAKSTAPNGTCIFCLKENAGIAVSCTFPGCNQCFHVYCARDAGQKPYIVAAAEGGYEFLFFCPMHKLSNHHSSSKDDINAILNTLQPRILKRSKKSLAHVEYPVHEYASRSQQKKRNDTFAYERNEECMVEAHLKLKNRDWSSAALFQFHNSGKSQLINFEFISRQQVDRNVFSVVNSDKYGNENDVCSDELWEATQKTQEEERALYECHKDLVEKITSALKDMYERENNVKMELKRERKILMSLKGIQKVRKAVDASRPSCLRHGGVMSVRTAKKSLRELLQDSAAMKEAKEDVSLGDPNSHRRRTQVIRNAASKNSSSVIPIKLKPVFKEEDNFEDFSSELPQELTACCSVCGSGECDEIGNDIILCDGCHVAVHQTCYGVRSIPEGDWFCTSCVAVGKTKTNDLDVTTSSLGYRFPRTHEQVPDPYRCILCPMVGGALKPTKIAGKWAHVSCAMWLSETYFENPEEMEPIMGSENVIAERWNLKCSVCNQRNVGPCIQCTLRHCGRAFHVSCGLSAGLHMEIKEDSSKAPGVALVALCPKHSRAHFSATEHSRVISLRKRRRSNSGSNMAEQFQKPFITKSQLKDELVDSSFQNESSKSEYGNNSPPISALELGDDISLHVQRLQKLHQNLEQVRNLCDLVRKREHLKRGLILLAFKVYNQHFSESFGSQAKLNDDGAMEEAEVQQGRSYIQKPLKLRLRGGGDEEYYEKPNDSITSEENANAGNSVTPHGRSGMVGAVAASAAAAVRAAGAAFRLHRSE